jgi:hypothetical protein
MNDRDLDESANIRRYVRLQCLLHDIRDAQAEAEAYHRLEVALQQPVATRHPQADAAVRRAA